MIPLPVLQVWDATGSIPLGVLGGLTALTVSEVFGEAGALSLTVPRDAPGAALIDTDDDRQLLLQQPGADPMWWVLDDDDSTWVSDAPESEPIQVTCRSLHALLEEAVVIPSSGIGGLPAAWAWWDQTPGAVVTDLVTSAQSRGLLQGITVAGDATVDATGTPWPDVLTVNHKAGTTLLAVLVALRDSQMMEHRWNGRTLELHRPGGGLDRSPDVVLRPRRDVISAPMKRSRRTVATAAVVEGADSVTIRRTQTLTGRRERETYVSETSAPTASLNDVGDIYLAAHTTADVQFTHDLTDGDDSPVPWVDYRPGDRVLTMAAGPTPVRRRVLQIAVARDDSGTTVTLELGSILKTAEEQMQLKLNRILPGDGAVT